MRISDWSSDVCSSDLELGVATWHRPRFQEPLPGRNPQLGQSCKLALILDPLCDHQQPERARQVDDRAHDDAIAGAAVDRSGESADDLEIVDRKPREQREAGIAGAEIYRKSGE